MTRAKRWKKGFCGCTISWLVAVPHRRYVIFRWRRECRTVSFSGYNPILFRKKSYYQNITKLHCYCLRSIQPHKWKGWYLSVTFISCETRWNVGHLISHDCQRSSGIHGPFRLRPFSESYFRESWNGILSRIWSPVGPQCTPQCLFDIFFSATLFSKWSVPVLRSTDNPATARLIAVWTTTPLHDVSGRATRTRTGPWDRAVLWISAFPLAHTSTRLHVLEFLLMVCGLEKVFPDTQWLCMVIWRRSRGGGTGCVEAYDRSVTVNVSDRRSRYLHGMVGTVEPNERDW